MHLLCWRLQWKQPRWSCVAKQRTFLETSEKRRNNQKICCNYPTTSYCMLCMLPQLIYFGSFSVEKINNNPAAAGWVQLSLSASFGGFIHLKISEAIPIIPAAAAQPLETLNQFEREGERERKREKGQRRRRLCSGIRAYLRKAWSDVAFFRTLWWHYWILTTWWVWMTFTDACWCNKGGGCVCAPVSWQWSAFSPSASKRLEIEMIPAMLRSSSCPLWLLSDADSQGALMYRNNTYDPTVTCQVYVCLFIFFPLSKLFPVGWLFFRSCCNLGP